MLFAVCIACPYSLCVSFLFVNLKEITEILTEFNIKFNLNKIIKLKEIKINENKL